MGSKLFDETMQNTAAVRDIFKRFFGVKHDPKWNIGNSETRYRFGCTCLFLSRLKEQDTVEVPFGPGVDPFKVFNKFRNQGLVHTTNNVVKYFRRATDTERQYVI